jgi:N-acetylglutamate synthase-like GNAT family acetyltransferase
MKNDIQIRGFEERDFDGKVVGCATVSYDETKAFVSCVYINNNYQGVGV